MDSLPDGTRLIHIGPQKTGSTALQWALHAARAPLRDHGVLYAGSRYKPDNKLGLGSGKPGDWELPGSASWQELTEEMGSPGYRLAVVSLESFGRAPDQKAARIVRDLGGPQPHVVAVARPYDRLMPSQWQQRVKSSFLQLSYEDWLRRVLGEPDPDDLDWRSVWLPHDTVELARRWTAAAGDGNFTLIVPPHGDRSLVPQTFASMLGVPVQLIDVEAAKPNASLTHSEAELVRRLNERFHDRGWTGRDYEVLVRRSVVPAMVKFRSPPDDPRIPPLPRWAVERLVELSDRRIEGLRQLGIQVVGDLETLRMDAASADGAREDIPAVETIPLDTAVRALEVMSRAAVRRSRRERRKGKARARRLRRKLRAARGAQQRPPSVLRRGLVRIGRGPTIRRGRGRANG